MAVVETPSVFQHHHLGHRSDCPTGATTVVAASVAAVAAVVAGSADAGHLVPAAVRSGVEARCAVACAVASLSLAHHPILRLRSVAASHFQHAHCLSLVVDRTLRPASAAASMTILQQRTY